MRILYCNKFNVPFGGTEVHLFELMELMRSQGHEVALFSTANPAAAPTRFDRHLMPPLELDARTMGPLRRLQTAGRVIYSFEARRRLRGMIAEFQPEVAHVRGIYHHLSPSILWELKSRNVPVLYHLNDFKLLCPAYNLISHGKVCERCRDGRFWKVVVEGCHDGPAGSAVVLAAEAYLHRWLRTYEKCVDLFLAPSQFVRDKLVEYGWQAEKIEVLPHFQNLAGESAGAAGADAPVLYFGRLSPEKGVADLLRAMTLAPPVRLQIAGDGPEREELEILTRRLSLENVQFVGHKRGEELEELIASCRFTVFPSRAYETLGKSMLESYAAGKAVIASDLGSRREFVQENKTGLLFPAGNVVQLAKAIATLVERPERAAEMGDAGRALARAQHSPFPYYARLMHHYEQLASRSRKPALTKVAAAGKPKLRIAFIGGRGVISGYSGIETYYEEAGKRLAAMGHEVTVYCRSYFTPAVRVHQGMRLVRLPTLRSKHLETAVHTLLSSLHVMFRGCDVVHYQTLGPALFSFLPRLTGKKTVVTVQGLDWRRRKWGKVARAALRLGEWASARLPNETVVVSETLRDYYHSRYGIEPAQVPNGAALRGARDPLRVFQWGLEPGKYILYLGRFSPEKNCRLLVECFEKISTDVKLVLAGGGDARDPYAEMVRRCQNNRVRILDWVSGADLDELVANAMLFVLPSEVEGLSLALLDAMGAGVCPLTSDIPDNCEVLGDAGFTFRRGDAQDLERMLRLLMFDSGMRRVAGQLSQRRVREHYLWNRVAAQIEAVYYGVMPGRGRAEEPDAEASLRRDREAA